MKPKVAFLGAGRWALALALGLERDGFEVALWEGIESGLERLGRTRSHPDLPPESVLPEAVAFSGNIAGILNDARLVFIAVPSTELAGVVDNAARQLPGTVEAVITVTKGIDPETMERLSVRAARSLPGVPVVVLAGPGIPYGYALGDPTSLVATSEDDAAARKVRDMLTSGNLRVYSTPDVIGVELGAALKNVYALAAGIADGLGLGINARAALLTRGLAEMTRLGVAMNANPLTFAGLSGMGDLIVTAFSAQSRNHSLGVLLGQGRDLESARKELNGVAEGATTAHTAARLGTRLGIEMPIAEQVVAILDGRTKPRRSVAKLLRRSPKEETL